MDGHASNLIERDKDLMKLLQLFDAPGKRHPPFWIEDEMWAQHGFTVRKLLMQKKNSEVEVWQF